MTSYGHTYGPSCSLHTEQHNLRPSEPSVDPPKIRAQFFYSSALPIDDPLSRVPPPTSSSATTPARVPPRPFSVFDNTALEAAWQTIPRVRHTEKEEPSLKLPPSSNSGDIDSKANSDDIDSISRRIENDGQGKSINDRRSLVQRERLIRRTPSTRLPSTKPSLALTSVGASGERQYGGDLTLCDNPEHIPFDHAMPVSSDETGNDEFEGGKLRRRRKSPLNRRNTVEKSKPKDGTSPPETPLQRKTSNSGARYGSSPNERHTTGTPFLRAASRLRRTRSRSPRSAKRESGVAQTDGGESTSDNERERPLRPRALFMRSWSDLSDSANAASDDPLQSTERNENVFRPNVESNKVYTTVGISRLHVVEMPDLRMGPIYWDPVHDISSVVRGTWFYKDTMMPVETDVANQIEEGYEYMKPWTQTYIDEVNSCLEIGADAELKLVHRLWPAGDSGEEVRPETQRSNMSLLTKAKDQLNSDERVRRHAIILAAKPENRAAGILEAKAQPDRLYAKSSVIFANSRDAQILRPNLLPSMARGRRPLAAIRKGRAVGVQVTRGFDHKIWEKLHPIGKKAAAALKSQEGQSISRHDQSGPGPERQSPCRACSAEQERPRPTDLVLVIHGIGQKLSERVESFHFTHAINAFRRQINVELEAAAVKPCMRQGFGGIMVLPINWRSTLKLDDAGPDSEPNGRTEDGSKNSFSLKDITADSIPAVRNLISDVMLDIPYYLSHHKTKMIEAVTKEANRVYRLWCQNNPWFEEIGRVHIIAHSLGSVMALDILSKQPTKLPEEIHVRNGKPHTDIFEFDTKNLFFCGSPAGLFLLLHRAPLLPRKGRDRPETDGEDFAGDVAGVAGTYGCLAVDNLYNILHYNDPIAYRVNACVDADYAAALQPASVPSTAYTWIQAIGSVFRGRSVARAEPIGGQLDHPPSRLAAMRLPSTLEMETHDFTREEIAERRMFLMNENGQIDFTLHSGGGPLEIQYLNMLSAHSSYWVLQDFVRFLVIEIGRKAGKSGTLPAMKAVKKIRGKG